MSQTKPKRSKRLPIIGVIVVISLIGLVVAIAVPQFSRGGNSYE